jgi:hypothetical protein
VDQSIRPVELNAAGSQISPDFASETQVLSLCFGALTSDSRAAEQQSSRTEI